MNALSSSQGRPLLTSPSTKPPQLTYASTSLVGAGYHDLVMVKTGNQKQAAIRLYCV